MSKKTHNQKSTKKTTDPKEVVKKSTPEKKEPVESKEKSDEGAGMVQKAHAVPTAGAPPMAEPTPVLEMIRFMRKHLLVCINFIEGLFMSSRERSIVTRYLFETRLQMGNILKWLGNPNFNPYRVGMDCNVVKVPVTADMPPHNFNDKQFMFSILSAHASSPYYDIERLIENANNSRALEVFLLKALRAHFEDMITVFDDQIESIFARDDNQFDWLLNNQHFLNTLNEIDNNITLGRNYMGLMLESAYNEFLSHPPEAFVFIAYSIGNINNNVDFDNFLKQVARRVPVNSLVIHGLMPQQVAVDKGLEPGYSIMLGNVFPKQLSFYDPITGIPRRRDMMQAVVKKNALVFVGGAWEGTGIEEELALIGNYDKERIVFINNPVNLDSDIMAGDGEIPKNYFADFENK